MPSGLPLCWKGNQIRVIPTKRRRTNRLSLWIFAFLGRQAYESEHISHLKMEGTVASWIEAFESEEGKTTGCASENAFGCSY